jgi:hypothetical protein
MLRPNFEISFNRACQKLCDKNQQILLRFESGKINLNKLNKFSPFVAIRTINNLAEENTDTQSMNTNLDYLIQKWDY